MTMKYYIKRWTAKRKAALVMEIIQGKSTVAEASRAFDLPLRNPSPRKRALAWF
jgi:transposase-like protein